MAVVGTGYLQNIILDGKRRAKILKDKGLDIPSEWTYQGTATGDASAGSITWTINFGLLDTKLYYVITNIATFNGPQGDSSLNINTDAWDNYYDTHIADQEVKLWCADSLLKGVAGRDLWNKILYLGRPNNQDANPGVLIYEIGNNTESSGYAVVLQGFALKHPLPLSSLPELYL